MDVIAVHTHANYALRLTFKNGAQREFDMRPLLSQKPWSLIANPSIFNRARVEYGTVVWPGEIDVAPETLWLDSRPLDQIEQP